MKLPFGSRTNTNVPLSDMFSIHSAKRIGSEHLRKLCNYQDSLVVIQRNTVIVGVVCDGVSQTNGVSRSEVGAQLLSQFISTEAARLHQHKLSHQEILKAVFDDSVMYLRGIASFAKTESERIQFIAENLLCTCVGFLLDHNSLTVFWYGDGFAAINDTIVLDDNQTSPVCLAYTLIDKRYRKQTILPTQFHSISMNTKTVDKLAIASDGLAQAIHKEPTLIHGLWGHQKKMGLQFWLHRAARNSQLFTDDTSIITVEQNLSPQTNGGG